MKIVIATPIYPPEIGGPATYTKELVERWQHEHDITVVAYTDNPEALPGSQFYPISKEQPLLKRLYQCFRTLYRLAKDADVLYVQNAMAAGLPAVLAGKLRGTPVVLKFVGDEAWERATQHKKTTKRLEEFYAAPDGGLKISVMRWLQGWVLRRADIVTTPSQYLGEAIQAAYHLQPKRVQTNYNAADKTTPAPFTAKKKPHQLVVTARLTAWKGVDGVIKAVKLLQAEYPDVHLIVHGDGPERENLEALAQTEGVSEAVTFTGNVSRTETWYTRKASAVYVLNSTYEGLPHTAITTFAAEIPIVATNIPGTNEAVFHEKTGLLVPPDDPAAVAAAVSRLFTDPQLGQTLLSGGNTILEERFSWDAHLNTLASFIESLGRKPVK